MTESEGAVNKVHHDETDVAFALGRVTADGPGDEAPAAGDFSGFPEEGVEKEE